MNTPRGAARVAALAERSLLGELAAWPKPGLVSDVDSGSHADMDAALFRRSAAVLRPFFRELVLAGAAAADMQVLRRIGRRAERAMLQATRGVNTHRGAIFGLGLLCAAAGVHARGCGDARLSLGQVVASRWGRDIVGGPRLPFSHGELAGRRHGAGGARAEAACGFPSVYQIGLPVLTATLRSSPGDVAAARVQTCFALIAALNDTNLLYRGGADGLRYAQQRAQGFLDDGGVRQTQWRRRAAAVHRAFVQRHLSPGGAADVLAMCLFVHELHLSAMDASA